LTEVTQTIKKSRHLNKDCDALQGSQSPDDSLGLLAVAVTVAGGLLVFEVGLVLHLGHNVTDVAGSEIVEGTGCDVTGSDAVKVVTGVRNVRLQPSIKVFHLQ
jgi:hypothetical protein